MKSRKKSIQINVGQSVQSPPTLGTVILKPTQTLYINQEVQSGKVGYTQNISVSTDKYGVNVAVPGPYASTFSSSLTAPIYLKAFDTQSQNVWFNYDGTNQMDKIKNIDTGLLPTLDTSTTITLAIAGKTPIISDICNSADYQGAGSLYMYATLMDAAASTWIKAFQTNAVTSAAVGLSTTTLGGVLPILKTQFDRFIYIGNGHKIDRVDPANNTFSAGNAVTLNAVGSPQAVPQEWFITALGEWNGQLVAAVNDAAPTLTAPGSGFLQRNGSGHSRLYFWDIANNPTGNFKNVFVNSPSHYISVLLTDLSGNLLAFGGVDEGRTSIYQWTGYGFQTLFSYIGDMPRNRHSVGFDSIGRLVWQTCNGQICRYDRVNDIFEHLNTVGAVGNGGFITVLQGAVGEDYLFSTGTGGNLGIIGLVVLRQFTGDGGGADTSTTPLIVSGLIDLPQKSIITTVIPSLNKALDISEKLEVRLYPQNYPTTGNYTVLGTMSYTEDGAVASKQIRSLQYYNDLASIGIAWKATAGSTTAPGVIGIEVDYNQITTV